MHFCMKDGKDMKKTVEELADKVKTDGATSETIAKEAESVMNNQVKSYGPAAFEKRHLVVRQLAPRSE